MKSEPASSGKFGRAIVMGASIAGLWTARALIDHFDEVLVLERDQLPEGPEFRSGAPQVRQFHTLLQAGMEQMRAWFPGLEEELVAAGAVPYDVVGDIHLRVRERGRPNQRKDDAGHTADLVVDALGRRSQTPEWLVELGYASPRESKVNSFLGYVTRKYKRKPNTPMLLIGATAPHDPYGGLVFPEEDKTMVAMIAGFNKRYPPTDPAEFDGFLGKLGP